MRCAPTDLEESNSHVSGVGLVARTAGASGTKSGPQLMAKKEVKTSAPQLQGTEFCQQPHDLGKGL